MTWDKIIPRIWILATIIWFISVTSYIFYFDKSVNFISYIFILCIIPILLIILLISIAWAFTGNIKIYENLHEYVNTNTKKIVVFFILSVVFFTNYI